LVVASAGRARGACPFPARGEGAPTQRSTDARLADASTRARRNLREPRAFGALRELAAMRSSP